MSSFVVVYLAVGLAVSLALYGWLAVRAIRRHGLRVAARHAARDYVETLPLYWRVPWVAWTGAIGLPLAAAWALVAGDWDPVGAAFIALLWLLYLALLLWHLRARARHR